MLRGAPSTSVPPSRSGVSFVLGRRALPAKSRLRRRRLSACISGRRQNRAILRIRRGGWKYVAGRGVSTCGTQLPGWAGSTSSRSRYVAISGPMGERGPMLRNLRSGGAWPDGGPIASHADSAVGWGRGVVRRGTVSAQQGASWRTSSHLQVERIDVFQGAADVLERTGVDNGRSGS